MIQVAVIGCGYWGAKHVRVFNEMGSARLSMVADPREARRAHIERTYRNVATVADYRQVLDDEATQGVVIATPVSTHFRLAREALLAGKDVLVEKPLAASAEEARELCTLADQLGRILMVGHTYVYHPAVDYLKTLVGSGALGSILYVDAARLNLGLFQPDTDVIWDLAPHDLSIILYVLEQDPVSLRARGVSHIGARRQIDVGYLDLTFPRSVMANIRVSWLDPVKVRRTTIVGSEKMVVFNDTAPDGKIRIFDRGVTMRHQTDDFEDFHLSYRNGDVMLPYVDGAEPLALECGHFVDCIRERRAPRSDGWSGYRVVRLLEAARQSLANNGVEVACDEQDSVLPGVQSELRHELVVPSAAAGGRFDQVAQH